MENFLVSLITSNFIPVSSWTLICSMTIFAELHISVSPAKIPIHDGFILVDETDDLRWDNIRPFSLVHDPVACIINEYLCRSLFL